MKSISVIIPTYNRAHTLARALDSVFNQTQPAAEVIVVDDGSTDNTEQLIRQNYPEVIYLKQDNLGVSAARNRAIGIAKGEWLALLEGADQEQVKQALAAVRKRRMRLDEPGEG